MVSTKFYCGYDEDVYLSDWAEQGDISQDHLKQLELEFLCAINWNLFVSNKDFFDKLKLVEAEIGKRQGLERGWLTYTEISNLLPSLAIARAFLQHTTMFAVSYAASCITIAGAFFLASKVPGTALYSLSKSETISVNIAPNAHGIVNETIHSSHLLAQENDSESECCNVNDILFDRLSIDLLENTIASQQPEIGNKNISIALEVMNIIPTTSLVSNSYVGFQSGVNLRSFLDENGSKSNETDYLMTMKHMTDESLCRNFGNLVTWMKLI